MFTFFLSNPRPLTRSQWEILLLRENQLLGPLVLQPKERTVKAQPKGNGGIGGHKANMVEVNSNSFRLESSLPIVNSITFSSEWWLESGTNIHICIDHS